MPLLKLAKIYVLYADPENEIHNLLTNWEKDFIQNLTKEVDKDPTLLLTTKRAAIVEEIYEKAWKEGLFDDTKES